MQRLKQFGRVLKKIMMQGMSSNFSRKKFEVTLSHSLSFRGETIYRLTVYRGTEASVRFTVQGGLEMVRQRFASVFI